MTAPDVKRLGCKWVSGQLSSGKLTSGELDVVFPATRLTFT